MQFAYIQDPTPSANKVRTDESKRTKWSTSRSFVCYYVKMMQRTHDLAAVALVSYRLLAYPPESLTWETVVSIGVATILGAMIPDIDNVASPAWRHKLLPWEGRATRSFLQGHRNISHSLIGLFLFSFIFRFIFHIVPLSHIDYTLVQQAFLLGHLSHLLTDSLTIQGVPWLYPIPFKFGFPPLSFLRVRTGGWVEKLIVFPGLLVLTIWIYYIYRYNIASIYKGLQL